MSFLRYASGMTIILLSLLLVNGISAAVLQNNEPGLPGKNMNETYEELTSAPFSNGNSSFIMNDLLIVPWFQADNTCTTNDLHKGASCNIGNVDLQNHMCMVTDELSQVGREVSMGQNSTRVRAFINTIRATKSNSGQIPAWRIVVDRTNGQLLACAPGVNGNCDTASDATARIIIALYDAAQNPALDQDVRDDALLLAKNLSRDMVTFEYAHECHLTAQGESLCYWLKAGTKASITGNDASYSGYYPDAIVAMLKACTATGNETYCQIASQTWKNYIAASYPQGYSITKDGFRVPPGRSFTWNFTITARAVCSQVCNPDRWDDSDAVRAFFLGIVQAQAQETNRQDLFPGMNEYMNDWKNDHLTGTNVVLQYNNDGTDASTPQSGYKATGLQAAALLGQDQPRAKNALEQAISHYKPNTKTWDAQSCAGIYGQAFTIIPLGIALGRSTSPAASNETQQAQENASIPEAAPAEPLTKPEAPKEETSIPEEQTPVFQTLQTTPAEIPGLDIGKLALGLGAFAAIIILLEVEPTVGTIVGIVAAIIMVISFI